MRTPSELAILRALRSRGQCPTMTVFVTECWKWADKLEDLGCLAIRVRNCDDWDHDWSPICGLSVILLQRFGDYAALGQAILAANPADFETYRLPVGSQAVCGTWLSFHDRTRRDYLIAKHLLAAA
jgi:hypothetical protein